MEESMTVFKSYLRRLLDDLKDIKKAIVSKDTDESEKLITKLIDDTQKDIES